MGMARRWLEFLVGKIGQRTPGVAWAAGALLILGHAVPALGQIADGTVTVSPTSQGSVSVGWDLQLVGGGPVGTITIQHCSAGAACSGQYDPTLFTGGVTMTNCTTAPCPNYVFDIGLQASTTYVEMVTMYPSASNTTGQITYAVSVPYTTLAFPVPSITSFQATTGSSVLLTTAEDDSFYFGMNVYGCPGTGCTNFTYIGNFFDGLQPTAVPASPTTLTGFVGGLTPSTLYTVYVTATDGVNTSAPSPTFTIQTPPTDTTPPTAPTNLTAAVISPTQVNLSYGASTDNVYLSGYNIEACAGAGCTNYTGVCGVLAPTLSCNATNLTPSTTYQFVAVAIDGSGNQSPPSNVVSVATLPGAPTTLTTSNTTSTQVTLSWTYTGNAAGLAGFSIEQCQGAGCTTFSQVAQVSSPSDQIAGLTPSTTYQFRVRSVDPAGDDSGYTNVVTVTTLPIAGPTALSATGLSDSQITLAWTASTAPGVSAYLVERCAGASCTDFVQIGSTPSSPYMDGGLLPLTTYQYRIRAQDATGDLSDYVTTSAATTTLAAPMELSGTAVSTSQINLSWFASASTGVATYVIERCSGAGCTGFSQIAAVSGTTYSDTGLAANTTYLYLVQGTDPAGALSSSGSAVAVTTFALAPATNLTATAVSSSQVALSWAASATSSATNYIVQRCNGAGCNGFTPIANVTSLSYTDSGLGASAAYSYRVQATDSGGDLSAASNVATAQTQSGSTTGGGSGPGGPGGGSGSGSNPATYVYESNGHLLQVITNSGTTTYTYDAAGHLVSIQNGS
jgi:YD repeat-containing protein